MIDRLERGEKVVFTLEFQEWRDEETTPIENTVVEWNPKVSPFKPVADLVINLAGLPRVEFRPTIEAMTKRADRMNFAPWHGFEGRSDKMFMRPLGNVNRARFPVYRASVEAGERDR
jgi:hypothetical protein